MDVAESIPKDKVLSQKLRSLIDLYKDVLTALSESLTVEKVHSILPDPYDHFVKKFKESKITYFQTYDVVLFFVRLDTRCQRKICPDLDMCYANSIIYFFQWLKCSFGPYEIQQMLGSEEIRTKWLARPIIEFFFTLDQAQQDMLIEKYCTGNDFTYLEDDRIDMFLRIKKLMYGAL